MNIRIIILSVVMALIAAICVNTEASPAATQKWVMDYVSTNSTSSASTTNILLIASHNLSGSSSEAYRIMQSEGSNRVERASQATLNAVYPTIDQIFKTCMEH